MKNQKKQPTTGGLFNTGNMKTAIFIATWFTAARNQDILNNPDNYEDPKPIAAEDLLNNMIQCESREELYELLEDWAIPDQISEMIFDLLSLQN